MNVEEAREFLERITSYAREGNPYAYELALKLHAAQMEGDDEFVQTAMSIKQFLDDMADKLAAWARDNQEAIKAFTSWVEGGE